MNRAVFPDRDGRLKDEVGYINHAARVRISGVVAAVRLIKRTPT